MFLMAKRSSRKPIKLQVGVVRFVVPLEDETTAEWITDLIVLKLKIEAAEKKHDLQIRADDNTLESTQPFLEELVDIVQSLGCPRCTVSMARQLWIAASEHYRHMEARFRVELARTIR